MVSKPDEAPGRVSDALAAAIGTVLSQVPFGRWLGLRLTAVEEDRVLMRFDMRDEMVGNPSKNALHGGIISSALDTVGGFAALLGVLNRSPKTSHAAELSPWLSTIDLRTDYLRPGIGDHFAVCAFPLRVGNRLVVTRMELHDSSGDLVAVGTGTYVAP